MEPNTDSSLFDLKIDENCKEELRGLSLWTKIVVITSVISLLFGFINVLMPKKTITRFENYRYETDRSGNIVGYLFTVVISLLLAYFLFQFSIYTKRGVDNLNQPDLIKGLSNLKSYFMTYGILIIIAMIVVLLALLFIGSGAIR
jgi:vacuolar-type H+-ATPase subunit I/STV1